MQAQVRAGVLPPYLLEILPPYLRELRDSHPELYLPESVTAEREKRRQSDSEQDVVASCIDLTADTPPVTPPLQADEDEGPMVITHLLEFLQQHDVPMVVFLRPHHCIERTYAGLSSTKSMTVYVPRPGEEPLP